MVSNSHAECNSTHMSKKPTFRETSFGVDNVTLSHGMINVRSAKNLKQFMAFFFVSSPKERMFG